MSTSEVEKRSDQDCEAAEYLKMGHLVNELQKLMIGVNRRAGYCLCPEEDAVVVIIRGNECLVMDPCFWLGDCNTGQDCIATISFPGWRQLEFPDVGV